MNIPIPPQLAADMAAAARRDGARQVQAQRTMVAFAVAAAIAVAFIYLVW